MTLESKVTLDGYGFICICHVYIPVYTSKYLNVSVVSDGVLVDHGFQLHKSKGKVDLKPPTAGSIWLSLSLDPDGRAYLYENLFSKPNLSIFSLRDTSICRTVLELAEYINSDGLRYKCFACRALGT